MLDKGSGGGVMASAGGDAVGQCLASANRELSHAIESLVRSGPEERGVARLGNALAALRQLNAKQALPANPQTVLSVQDRTRWLGPLKEMSERAARAERLLVSAAAFYTGWFSAPPVAASGYTAEGRWAAVEGSGGLRLEA